MTTRQIALQVMAVRGLNTATMPRWF